MRFSISTSARAHSCMADNPRTGADSAELSNILNALPVAILTLGRDNQIEFANAAAEQMLGHSAVLLERKELADLLPEDSPLLGLVDQVRGQGNTVMEYGIRIAGPRIGEWLVDVQVAPMLDDKKRIVMAMQERSVALRIDHQFTHRRAARSIAGMAGMLAHEVRNPLSGIRGAAQLLDRAVSGSDRELTQLICLEADRIGNLVDRMDVFADDRPTAKTEVNIHTVLDHVRQLAVNGFAKNVDVEEQYDPSIPAVLGNRDQLIQIFLNLLKNAAEAVPQTGGRIRLITRYQHGWRMAVAGGAAPVQLPIVVTVQDNGPGVPDSIRANLFEPFVTTKARGTGLGLSLVAKLVQDHGGVIEIDSKPRCTAISVLLPRSGRDGEGQ